MWSSNYSLDPETAQIDLGYRNMVPKEWDVTSVKWRKAACSRHRDSAYLRSPSLDVFDAFFVFFLV